MLTPINVFKKLSSEGKAEVLIIETKLFAIGCYKKYIDAHINILDRYDAIVMKNERRQKVK
jgi:hypothetical protein